MPRRWLKYAREGFIVDTVTLPRMGIIRAAVSSAVTDTDFQPMAGLTSTIEMVRLMPHHIRAPMSRNAMAPQRACHHFTDAMAAEGDVAK